MHTQLGFGIVGTGAIARVVADAIARSTKAKLVAVSSRSLDSAKRFVANRTGAASVEGIDNLLARSDVRAVYIATPTATKEKIALAAIGEGKHVLVDKPFVDQASVLRMTKAASEKQVAFMDATHFVHHPRTSAIQRAVGARIGTPRSLHTTFYFPISDRGNIRFDPKLEPMTALGDMAWYSMRAIVEYLRPQGKVARATTVTERDPVTSAIIRASGIIAFESGETSTFDVGYTAGTVIMSLQLLGTIGVIEMDDFVLIRGDSFAFKNPDLKAGFSHRTAMATRKDAAFVESPASLAQEVQMIETFADLAASNIGTRRADYAEATLKTQQYLDAIWNAVNS